MADSLSPKCTPLKHEYDSCFNSWFAGYLEPAVNINSSSQAKIEEKTREYAMKKAEDYERKCGKVWEEYKSCLEV
jgi:TRIAP1/MDM35 family protein